jgi:DNA polymerase beta
MNFNLISDPEQPKNKEVKNNSQQEKKVIMIKKKIKIKTLEQPNVEEVKNNSQQEEVKIIKKKYKKKVIEEPKVEDVKNDTQEEEVKYEKEKHELNMVDMKNELIDSLDKLRKKEVANKETWKARAYLIVIKELKNLEGPVCTFDDVKEVKGIGESMELKIKELLATGFISQLADYNVNGHIKIMDELLKIHGIGPSKAKELVENNNIKSIDELKNNLELLNDTQKIGIKYWEDFEKRIPREEMEKHNEYLTKALKEIDSRIVGTITGSYRRLMSDSGDIDVLLTHPDDPENFEDVMKLIVEKMKKDYIKDILALGSKKCMAVCRLKSYKTFRRLDLFYTRKHEYPFAVLHFTGSGEFNTKIRNIALSKGYSLSEHGIKYNDKDGKFIDFEFNDEKDIFKFLGIKYINPEDRIPTINLKEYLI